MGVVHQQPLGKLYCFILKIPLYLRFFWEISTYPNSFLGHNLSRFTCLGNDPRKPTSGRKTPEIHAAPRLPDVLTALRRPFFGKSWETRGPSTQKYRLSNTFLGVWKGMLRNISKSWKWKKKAKLHFDSHLVDFWLTCQIWFQDPPPGGDLFPWELQERGCGLLSCSLGGQFQGGRGFPRVTDPLSDAGELLLSTQIPFNTYGFSKAVEWTMDVEH